MRWSHVWLVFRRDLTDQLRDRRMLLFYLGLPFILYPLLGVVMVQMMQVVEQRPVSIEVVGREFLPASPPLFEGDAFRAEWFSNPADAKRIRVRFRSSFDVNGEAAASPSAAATTFEPTAAAASSTAVTSSPVASAMATADPTPAPTAEATFVLSPEGRARLVIRPGFAEAVAAYQAALELGQDEAHALEVAKQHPVPPIEIYYTTADEVSQVAWIRMREPLRRWTLAVVRQGLLERGVPRPLTMTPFDTIDHDLAEKTGMVGFHFWGAVLPMFLLLWGFTGAFQPAIDLCAGEKERGTLETLLCSPVSRVEIVWGKLLVIAVFSAATVLFNVLSLACTASALLHSVVELGAPPWSALLWLLIALAPVSIFFAAISLAVAAFARSVQEGHVYMMPVLLVLLPLLLFPMIPDVRLQPGYAIIPVVGLSLLLRALVEGSFATAWPYIIPVTAITCGCAWIAVRWAVEQFSQEDVLFRAGERVDLRVWARRFIRRRGRTPSPVASLCGGLFLMALPTWLGGAVAGGSDLVSFTRTMFIVQGTLAAAAIGLAVLCSTSLRDTFWLRAPRFAMIPLVILLAITLHPVATAVSQGVQWLYPMSEAVREQLQGQTAILKSAPWWQLFFLIALLPAIAEELAFRGFVLSGVAKLRSPLAAIAISSLMFGFAHGLLQQSLSAVCTGMVIGWLVLRSQSLLIGSTYHVSHNILALWPLALPFDWLTRWPALTALLSVSPDDPHDVTFRAPVVFAAGLLAATVLWAMWYVSRGDVATSEEHEHVPG